MRNGQHTVVIESQGIVLIFDCSGNELAETFGHAIRLGIADISWN